MLSPGSATPFPYPATLPRNLPLAYAGGPARAEIGVKAL